MPWGKAQQNNLNYLADQIHPSIRYIISSTIHIVDMADGGWKPPRLTTPHGTADSYQRCGEWAVEPPFAQPIWNYCAENPLKGRVFSTHPEGKEPSTTTLAPKAGAGGYYVLSSMWRLGACPKGGASRRYPPRRVFSLALRLQGEGRLDDPDDHAISSRQIQAGGVRRHTKGVRYGNTEETKMESHKIGICC